MEPVDVANSMTQEKPPLSTPVVYDEAAGTFGSSWEIKDPAIAGEFEANGIKVRPVYAVVVEQIKPFTVEYAADRCGLPVEQVIELCELYAKNKPAKVINWCGYEHTENSWRQYFSQPFLASLTGNACVPGGGYNCGYSQGSTIFKTPVTLNKSAATDLPWNNKAFTLEYLPQVLETGEWAGEKLEIKDLLILDDEVLGSRMGPGQMEGGRSKLDCRRGGPVHDLYGEARRPRVPHLAFVGRRRPQLHLLSHAESRRTDGRGETFPVAQGHKPSDGMDRLMQVSASHLREALDTPENIEAGVAYDDFAEKGVIYGEYNEAEGAAPVEYNPTGRTQFFLERLIPNNDWGQVFDLSDRIPSYKPSIVASKDNPQRSSHPLFG